MKKQEMVALGPDFTAEIDREHKGSGLVTVKFQKDNDGFYVESANHQSMLVHHDVTGGYGVTTFGEPLEIDVASLEKITKIKFYQPKKETRAIFRALDDLEMEQDALADGLANSKAGSEEFKLYKDLLRKRDALRKIIRLFKLSERS